jgi:hypothetical protein
MPRTFSDEVLAVLARLSVASASSAPSRFRLSTPGAETVCRCCCCCCWCEA